MFGRVSSANYICLNCRLQLRPNRIAPVSSLRSCDTTSRRYQSAVAVQVEEDEDERYGPQDPEKRRDAPVTPAARKTKKRKLSPIWRPTATADLGMNALGKPSEVLLVAPRDRIIPEVPTDGHDEAKESLHESLTSETQPSSWSHVKENIDQAKGSALSSGTALTFEAWTKLKKTLITGFTKKQLEKYFEESSTTNRLRLKNKRLYGKEPLIKIIAKHAWKLELPNRPAPPESARISDMLDREQHQPEPQLQKEMSAARCSRRMQIVLKRNTVNNLQKMARSNNVKIKFDEKKKTIISGPAESVDLVRALLKEQTNGIKKVIRPIDGSFGPFAASDIHETFEILIETLAQKYGIYAKVKSTTTKAGWVSDVRLIVSHLGKDNAAADHLCHELSMMGTARDQIYETVDVASTPARLVRYYTGVQSKPYAHRDHMFRAVSAPNKQFTPDAWRAVALTLAKRSRQVPESNVIMARFGIVLHTASEKQVNVSSGMAIVGGTAALEGKKSEFVEEPSLVPFVLGNMMRRIDEKAHGLQTSCILRFRPIAPNKSGNTFEVICSTDAGDLSTTPLHVDQIRLYHKGIGLNMILPGTPVDVQLTCRREQLIYGKNAASEKNPVKSSKLLDAINQHLSCLNSTAETGADMSLKALPLFTNFPRLDNSEDQASGSNQTKDVQQRYILVDYAITSTDTYEFQYKSAKYTLEHTTRIAQNPNDHPKESSETPHLPNPFSDSQTLTLKMISPATLTIPETKKEAKSSTKQPANTEFVDFFGAIDYVVKQFSAEAEKLRLKMSRNK